MALAWTKAEGLELLYQLFLTGMSVCQLEFHVHADLLHISVPLFNFVTREAFNNHGNYPVCPSGVISAWTSLQGLGDRGAAVASNLADIRSQVSCLTNADSLACGAKVALSVIVNSDNLLR